MSNAEKFFRRLEQLHGQSAECVRELAIQMPEITDNLHPATDAQRQYVELGLKQAETLWDAHRTYMAMSAALKRILEESQGNVPQQQSNGRDANR